MRKAARWLAAAAVLAWPVPVGIWGWLMVSWQSLPRGPGGEPVMHSFPIEEAVRSCGLVAFSWTVLAAAILAWAVWRSTGPRD